MHLLFFPSVLAQDDAEAKVADLGEAYSATLHRDLGSLFHWGTWQLPHIRSLSATQTSLDLNAAPRVGCEHEACMCALLLSREKLCCTLWEWNALSLISSYSSKSGTCWEAVVALQPTRGPGPRAQVQRSCHLAPFLLTITGQKAELRTSTFQMAFLSCPGALPGQGRVSV